MQLPKFQYTASSLLRHFIAIQDDFAIELSSYIFRSFITPAAVKQNIRIRHCDSAFQCPRCQLYGLLHIEFTITRYDYDKTINRKTNYESYHHKLVINRSGYDQLEFALTYNALQGVGDYNKVLVSKTYSSCLAEPDFKGTEDIITALFENITIFPYNAQSLKDQCQLLIDH